MFKVWCFYVRLAKNLLESSFSFVHLHKVCWSISWWLCSKKGVLHYSQQPKLLPPCLLFMCEGSFSLNLCYFQKLISNKGFIVPSIYESFWYNFDLFWKSDSSEKIRRILVAIPLSIPYTLDFGVEEFDMMYWWILVGFEYTGVVILRSDSSFWMEIVQKF